MFYLWALSRQLYNALVFAFKKMTDPELLNAIIEINIQLVKLRHMVFSGIIFIFLELNLEQNSGTSATKQRS